MAQCYLCNAHVGSIFSPKWVNLDGQRFCPNCADQWQEKRRLDILEAMHAGGDPVCLFEISGVRTRDPDKPKSKEVPLGIAAFTDKGICFLEITQFQKPDAAMTFLFGAIVGAIAAHSHNVKEGRRYAISEAEARRFAPTFMDMLADTPRLIYYPVDDITRLKHGGWGFEVRVGKVRKKFAFMDGRKAYKAVRQKLRTYADAVRTGHDLVAAFRNVPAAR